MVIMEVEQIWILLKTALYNIRMETVFYHHDAVLNQGIFKGGHFYLLSDEKKTQSNISPFTLR